MSTTLIIILAVSLIIILYIVGIYNKLVALKNRLKNAFAQIEVQLKRRHDLIPNLVEIAKKYMDHENSTLKAVTEARSGAQSALETAALDPTDATAIKNLTQAEGVLNKSLGQFNMVMEAYPDLKASQNMIQLSEELTSTENKVSFARQAYNDEVMVYNTYKQSFPQIIIAGALGHGADSPQLEFEDSKEIQNAPKITF
jgi:LemA protein